MNARNLERWKRVQISRAWKDLLLRVPVPGWLRVIAGLATAVFGRRWAYRLALTSDGALLRVSSQAVLADLRDFAFARTSAFDPDPIIMARRQGRRDVWLRVSNYLTLDEAQVQTLMEIDDGI